MLGRVASGHWFLDALVAQHPTRAMDRLAKKLEKN